MVRPILHHDGFYFEWSIERAAPHTYGMFDEKFEIYYRKQYGQEGMNALPDRLKRARATGTSILPSQSLGEFVKGNRAGPEGAELSLKYLLKTYCDETLADEFGVIDPIWPDSSKEDQLATAQLLASELGYVLVSAGDTPDVTRLSAGQDLETVLSQMEKEEPTPALVDVMRSTAPWESQGQTTLELRQGLQPDMTIVYVSTSSGDATATAIRLNRIAEASIFQVRQSRDRAGEPLHEWFVFGPRRLLSLLRSQGLLPEYD